MTEAALGFGAVFLLALLRVPLAVAMALVGIAGLGLSAVELQGITHLVVASCTGMTIPEVLGVKAEADGLSPAGGHQPMPHVGKRLGPITGQAGVKFKDRRPFLGQVPG